MGIVYLAREVRLARPVAIKLLPRALAANRPEVRERFVREAQMAAQLSHPNIVPIHHVDEVGEFVFFVMAYIEGGTLGDRLRERGAIPPAEAARLLREIGWALAYAHLRGIVHRDVKPDNILLERQTSRALVSDFGIAGAARTASSADAGYIRGTVHYLSPEQASGEAVDERSDIYSLGVLGYYALTGRLPFDGATPTAVLTQHLTQTPPSIVRVAPAVPHRLASAVEKCLEKTPARRWATGEAFAEAVDAAFEQPKEIPAPLRVWLTNTERHQRAQVVFALYVALSGVGFAVTYPLATVSLLAPLMTAIVLGPEIARTRRVLKLGFTLDDIRVALHTHTMRRREELVYEAGDYSATTLRWMALVSAAGFLAALAASPFAFGGISPPVAAITVFSVGLITGVIGTVATLGEYLRRRLATRFGAGRLKLYNSRWGERLARLAGFGIKRTAGATSALPQYTEVALGRATDALFNALPKQLRKEFKDVPDTVRRLEADAKSLRETLDRLDDAIAAAARVAGDRAAVASGAADDRDLRRQREVASERLAAAVAALESIRLGLLRLQIGAAPVASVTEALEAASRVGHDISIVIAAEGEVQRALEPGRG